MVAQAAISILPALPPIPPSPAQPYQGENTTASVRASLQNALDSYTPGNIGLIVANPTSADLKHTRSFGETHANELSRINSSQTGSSNVPASPPATAAAAPPPAPSSHTAIPPSPKLSYSTVSPSSPLAKTVPAPLSASPPRSFASAPHPGTTSPPLNPANLNQAPAPIPIPAAATSPVVAPDPSDPTTKVPSVTPTVAETGVPQVAGPDGPGPASGSLLGKKATANPPPVASPIASLPPPRFPTAEEEKQRLEREEREKLLRGEGVSGPPSSATGFESAEDEKKRLEREEREKLLRGDAHPDAGHKPPGEDDADLPPYQEF